MDKTDSEIERNRLRLRSILSIVFLTLLMYVAIYKSLAEFFHVAPPAVMIQLLEGRKNALTRAFSQFVLLLPILYMHRDYYENGFRQLLHGKATMESLVAVGTGASVLYGIFAIVRMSYGIGNNDMRLVELYADDLYFETAGLILTLLSLGKLLEEESAIKTSKAVVGLRKLSPEKAIVKRHGTKVEIPVEELRKGELFYLEPGMRVPADGMIVRGKSSLDESAITGESFPVEKIPGSKVVTATVNLTGNLTCQAEKTGVETTLAQIIKLVEKAGESKTPISRLGDKIAAVYVPFILAVSIITFLVWLGVGERAERAMGLAIAVIVIACPCALGLATPLATMMGTGAGIRNSIFIKSGDILQLAQNIDTIILDKTGTITEGVTKITDVFSFGGYDQKAVLSIAASLESCEEHIYSAPLLQAASEYKCELEEMKEFHSIYGKGCIGKRVKNDDRVAIGTLELVNDLSIEIEEKQKQCVQELNLESKIPYFILLNNSIIGIITISDVIKETSFQAIQQMKKMGLNVVMLTGDTESAARFVAKRLGLKNVVSEVLPAEKEKEIARLKQAGRKVAMIGDGINDAPALASATVGIAIGAGADIAIESADIVLMRNDLQDAVKALKLSKSVIHNIKQNLFWSFLFPVLSIPLAAGALYPIFHLRLDPMFGALVMSISSLFVLVNSFRLRVFH